MTQKEDGCEPSSFCVQLFAEQVAVCACPRQRQHQNVVFDAVNQQPVGLNVAFPMPDPIAGQFVVAVFGRQRFAVGQHGDDVFQQLNFNARWIPLENAYFDAYHLPDESCVLVPQDVNAPVRP